MSEIAERDGAPPGDQRGLGALLGELAGESATLVRQEVALAKLELTQKTERAAADGGMVLLGGATANAGLVVLLAGLAFALSAYVPLWGSLLGLGALAIVVGGVLTQRGLRGLRTIDVVPEKTVATLKEDVRWAKGQLP